MLALVSGVIYITLILIIFGAFKTKEPNYVDIFTNTYKPIKTNPIIEQKPIRIQKKKRVVSGGEESLW